MAGAIHSAAVAVAVFGALAAAEARAATLVASYKFDAVLVDNSDCFQDAGGILSFCWSRGAAPGDVFQGALRGRLLADGDWTLDYCRIGSARVCSNFPWRSMRVDLATGDVSAGSSGESGVFSFAFGVDGGAARATGYHPDLNIDSVYRVENVRFKIGPPPTAVPAPAAFWLLATALGAMGLRTARKGLDARPVLAPA